MLIAAVHSTFFSIRHQRLTIAHHNVWAYTNTVAQSCQPSMGSKRASCKLLVPKAGWLSPLDLCPPGLRAMSWSICSRLSRPWCPSMCAMSHSQCRTKFATGPFPACGQSMIKIVDWRAMVQDTSDLLKRWQQRKWHEAAAGPYPQSMVEQGIEADSHCNDDGLMWFLEYSTVIFYDTKDTLIRRMQLCNLVIWLQPNQQTIHSHPIPCFFDPKLYLIEWSKPSTCAPHYNQLDVDERVPVLRTVKAPSMLRCLTAAKSQNSLCFSKHTLD